LIVTQEDKNRLQAANIENMKFLWQRGRYTLSDYV
jgi:hypothetical protein